MFKNIYIFIKSHLLISLIILGLAFVFIGNLGVKRVGRSYNAVLPGGGMYDGRGSGSGGMDLGFMPETGGGPAFIDNTGSNGKMGMYAQEMYAPSPSSTARMVITNSYVNAVVKNVSDSISAIKSQIEGYGGYVVNTYMTKSESNGYGNITVRVPLTNLSTFLAFVKDSSVKISSENIEGYDITDQYTDLEDRIKSLEETIAAVEKIKNEATKVEDIINIQNQIFNLKSQLDSYKGQAVYFENSSKTALVTINLSTDEYSLPYSEPLTWRPEVIFKLAVRSLLSTLQGFGGIAIWLAVYSVIIVPTIFIFVFILKKIVKGLDKLFKI